MSCPARPPPRGNLPSRGRHPLLVQFLTAAAAVFFLLLQESQSSLFSCSFFATASSFSSSSSRLNLTVGISTLNIDVLTDFPSNPHIDPNRTSPLLLHTPTGIASSVDPSSVPSYSLGLVGLYPFDAPVDGTVITDSSGPGDVIIRGSVPCTSALSSLINSCRDAYLVGDGDASIAPLETNAQDVKFGTGALNVRNESWAEIDPGPFRRNQPTNGITVAGWIKSTNTVLKGKLWERMFDNFDLIGRQRSGSNCFECEFGGVDGNTAKYFYARHCMEPSVHVNTTVWMHVACAYEPSGKQLTIYYNGIASETTYINLVNTDFRHGDYQAIGIGNRAGYGTYRNKDGFVGKIDDFAMWGRALSAMEILDLYNSNAPIELVEFPIFETKNFVKVDAPTEREFSAVTVSWTVMESNGVDVASVSTLMVEISTDSGKEWCQVSNNVIFTDAFHGGDHLVCLFPAVTLKIRVRWNAQVLLTSMSATFHPVSPLETSRPNVPIGMNVGGVSYYSSAWPFVDMYKASGGCCWPSIRSGTDSDGWPLEIDPNNPVDNDKTTYWKVGRALIGRRGFYPAGEYTLYAEGSGEISLAFDAGNHKFQAPCTYKFNVTEPSGDGTQITIEKSVIGDHIRNVRVMMPGFSTSTDLFHPEYLSSLEGFTLLRFMDWAATNSLNRARWYQRIARVLFLTVKNVSSLLPLNTRATPTSISQSRVIVEEFDIINTTITEDTLFSGKFLVLAYTSSPHTLVTGQVVHVTNTGGSATATNGEIASFDFRSTMVEVVNDRSFIYSFKPYSWDDSYVIDSYENGYGGKVRVDIRSGVSLEYQIELANTMNVDAWFNVPHLADDDYIQNMAELIYANLRPNLKAYIEYSNEIWNWAPSFVQTRYAYKRATEEGITGGSRHLVWYGEKVAKVQNIFTTVFGTDAPTRLVRVLAVQAGSGNIQLEAATSGSTSVDALAIAPYFGGNLNYDVYMQGWQNFTVDDILDMARYDIVRNVLQRTKSSFLHAQEYKVRLIAYEGGQHMGGSGDCEGEDCNSVVGMQELFQRANHDHRIKGLYKNMLKAWQQEGGQEFASFSHIGEDTKYGSWGVLQHQMDDKSTAWKYQALMENLGGPAEITEQPSPKPSSKPSSKPSPKPSSKPSPRPSSKPVSKPTSKPAPRPTSKPAPKPTAKPTKKPSVNPTKSPTQEPTQKSVGDPTPSPSKNPTDSPTRRKYQVVTTKCSYTYTVMGISPEQLNAQFDKYVDIFTKSISTEVSNLNWKVDIKSIGGIDVKRIRSSSASRSLQANAMEVDVELTKINICLSDDGCSVSDIQESVQEGVEILSTVVQSVESGTFLQTIKEEAASAGLAPNELSTLSIDEVVVTEEPQTEVIDPTPFPSTDITSSPSLSPQDPPSHLCHDSPFRFRLLHNDKLQSKPCEWVKRHPTWKCKLDGVSSHCPSTCGACETCSDSTNTFVMNDHYPDNPIKSCDWVKRKQTKMRCAIPGVGQTCRSTCGTCCMDSTDTFSIIINGKPVRKTCIWAARNNKEKRCQAPVVSLNCPKTCGTC